MFNLVPVRCDSPRPGQDVDAHLVRLETPKKDPHAIWDALPFGGAHPAQIPADPSSSTWTIAAGSCAPLPFPCVDWSPTFSTKFAIAEIVRFPAHGQQCL